MRFFDGLRQELAAWGKTEGLGWIYVLKTTIAALLAMGISMRLELGQPVTAMVTVYILMHPQTGMVLTKSLYRICGTLAGAFASLILLGLFAQERVLFLGGLAVWVGLCTAGAALYRNFKSYGFTLAGYTAALICIPLIMQPTGFFDYAVNRVTEVMVGIICAGVVSEVLFPRSLGDSVIKTMAARYDQFVRAVQDLLSGGFAPHEIDRMHLHIVGNAVGLESQRSSLFMETSAIRAHDRRLRQLNNDFLAMSTTLHSLCQLMARLRNEDAEAAATLAALHAPLAHALASAGGPVNDAKSACQTAYWLDEFLATLPEQMEMIRHQCRDCGGKAGLDTETAMELFNRFVREMRDSMRTYVSLEDNPRPGLSDSVRFASRTDPAVALLTGVRAMTVILLVAAFWIASAWPYGATAVMMAAITSALFAPAPDPVLALKTGLLGVIAGFVAAFLCKFLVLTSLHGIGLLLVGMFPFLLVGPYLSLNPKLAVTGLGYSTMFCFTVSPANKMVYDPVQFINFGSALALGVATGAVIFATFVPVTGGWVKRRTARMLREQVEIACSRKLAHLGSRFESATRDLLQRIAARPNPQDIHDREALGWLFLVLEIGRAVIELRRDAASIPLPQPVSTGIQETLKRLERLFRQPNVHNHSAALQAAGQTIKAILSESVREGVAEETVAALRRMLTSLHLICSSLLDEESILEATTSRSRGITQGETTYAT